MDSVLPISALDVWVERTGFRNVLLRASWIASSLFG
jgi:hypothetical protein